VKPQLEHEEARLERALRQVGDVAAGLELLSHRMGAVLDELERAGTPGSLTRLVLTAAQPIATDRHRGDPSRSIGLLNPSPIVVYLGIGATPARANAGAIAVPANSLIVLPVWAESIDVGATAADLATGDAVVHLLRFPSVQPAFLGAL
jgi:hypothetical protein